MLRDYKLTRAVFCINIEQFAHIIATAWHWICSIWASTEDIPV